MKVENGGQLDTRVRITNLPDECVISIYTINGSLIKQLNKDSEGSASIDWDLKIKKGFPASGAYIINVSVPSIGKERNLNGSVCYVQLTRHLLIFNCN